MQGTIPFPNACPCGGGAYNACCGPLHAGAAATDAARLMRSRYSAYVLRLEAYLLETWHISTRPISLDLADEVNTKWLGLALKHHARTDERTAVVEFVACYKVGGRAHRLHEVSHFVREANHWYYVDGEFPATRQFK